LEKYGSVDSKISGGSGISDDELRQLQSGLLE
jgi:hypothetical protein